MWCPRYACRPRPHAAPVAAALSVTAYRRSPVAATPAPPRCPLPCPVDTAAPCLRPRPLVILNAVKDPSSFFTLVIRKRSEGSIFPPFAFPLSESASESEGTMPGRLSLVRHSLCRQGIHGFWPFLLRGALAGKNKKDKQDRTPRSSLRMTRPRPVCRAGLSS